MQDKKSKQKKRQKDKELDIELLNKNIQKDKEESENEEMDEEEQLLSKKKIKKINQGKNKDETKDKNQDISREKKKEKDQDKYKSKKKDKKKDKKGKVQVPKLVINSADSDHFEQEENQDEEFQEKAFENQDQEDEEVDEQQNLEIHTKGIEVQRIDQTPQMGFRYCSFVKQSEDNIEQILNSVKLLPNEMFGLNKIKSKLNTNQDIEQDENQDLPKLANQEDLQQYDEMGKPIKKKNEGLIRLTHSFRIR